jgi:hypothetical protein
MRYVWVVVGFKGEYSLHTQWLVTAYPDEDQARHHAGAAEALAKECWAAHEAAARRHDWQAAGKAGDPLREAWDPQADLDDLIEYDVRRVPLVRHVDEFKELHLGEGLV